MKNKKGIALIAIIALIAGMGSKAKAVKFYDTVGTRYEGAVERLGELGVINGVKDKVYAPDKYVTRAEMAKIMVEATMTKQELEACLSSQDSFPYQDVSSNSWYYAYVLAATNYGLLNGYENQTFRPENEITYEELSKILMRVLGHDYLVETDPRGWSAEYMDKMYALKVNEGTTKFQKTDKVTRGNLAIMLWNTLTENEWKMIYLNDVAGFTYVDSGVSLLNKKHEPYDYLEEATISAFRERNGKLEVQINKTWYKLFDQSGSYYFTMLGGKADALLMKVSYPSISTINEIAGLSCDIDTKLYEGSLQELKADGISLSGSESIRMKANADYAYLHYDTEQEKALRTFYLNSDTNFYIESIKITDEEIEGDSEEVDDDEKKANVAQEEVAHIYSSDDKEFKRTVVLNNEDEANAYTIEDGAVLFENNKRVEWSSVKKGDVITEIKKDQYYFLTRSSEEVTLEDVKRANGVVTFSTSKGEYVCYEDTRCLEYLAEDSTSLSRIRMDDLTQLIGKKIKLSLNFVNKVAYVEFLDSYYDEVAEELNLAYYKEFTFSGSLEKPMYFITLLSLDGKETTYRTTLEIVNAKLGDLVTYELKNKKIEEIKVVSASMDINSKVELKKVNYSNLMKKVDGGYVDKNTVAYKATYQYAFGEEDEITDFSCEKISIEDLEDINGEKADFYMLSDDKGIIKMIMVKDYSQKREVFYGFVEKIYYQESDKKMKIQVDVVNGESEREFNLSGLANCEEGDMISFRFVDSDTIKPVEKYSPEVLGYYKDIVVESINKKPKTVETNFGTVDFFSDIIQVGEKEYNASEYVWFLMKIRKNTDGEWMITDVQEIERSKIDFQKGDRIAIDEIEDTMILYRGYEDSSNEA